MRYMLAAVMLGPWMLYSLCFSDSTLFRIPALAFTFIPNALRGLLTRSKAPQSLLVTSVIAFEFFLLKRDMLQFGKSVEFLYGDGVDRLLQRRLFVDQILDLISISSVQVCYRLSIDIASALELFETERSRLLSTLCHCFLGRQLSLKLC